MICFASIYDVYFAAPVIYSLIALRSREMMLILASLGALSPWHFLARLLELLILFWIDFCIDSSNGIFSLLVCFFFYGLQYSHSVSRNLGLLFV